MTHCSGANFRQKGEKEASKLPPEPNCKQDITRVDTRTLTIDRKASKGTWVAKKVASYELSLELCDQYILRDISSQKIQFDIDAQLSMPFGTRSSVENPFEDSSITSVLDTTDNDPIRYRILGQGVDGEPRYGNAIHVSGSDLFGNTGAFAHYRIDTLDLIPSKSIRIDFDLTPYEIDPRRDEDRDKEIVPFMFRIGESQSAEGSVPLSK